MSRHIVLVIHAFHGGGAERIAATLANQWVARGRRVTAITLDAVASDVYRVDPAVRRIGLDVMGTSRNSLAAVWNNRRRIRALRRAIRDADPDCVVSLTDKMNVVTLLAGRRLPYPVIATEQSDPRHQRLGPPWERLRRWAYPRAAALVVQTHGVAEYLRPIMGDRPIHVIPSGIERPAGKVVACPDPAEPLVVALGRLSPEKGFDQLIEAFARVAPVHPQWRLEIAGKGSQQTALQECIESRQLGGCVRLVGWVEDPPYDFLARGAMFVMPSRYEGFPVALLEAMALGLAVISFDCESGPGEIIQHETNGLLVPPGDCPELARAIRRLIEDEPLRQRLGSAAVEVARGFDASHLLDRWEPVLEEAIASRSDDAS